MGMAYVARDKTISLEPIIAYFEWVEMYLNRIRAIEAEEKEKNEPLQSSYRNWTYYSPYVSLTFDVGRVDGASVSYKSFAELKSTLQHQPSSVKRVYAHMTLSYDRMTNGKNEGKQRRSTFDMTLRANGFKFEYDIDPEETALVQATDSFVAKIDQMPVKLDRIIKQKDLIIMKVGFAMGLIPAVVLAVASLFVPALKSFYAQYFVSFPGLTLAAAFIIGIFLGNFKLGGQYSRLIPTKYGGYDVKTHSSYRVDDMETFCEEVDVLIGDRSDLGSARKYIESNEKALSKLILPGLVAVLIATGVAALFVFVIK